MTRSAHWEGKPTAVWEGLWGVPVVEAHDVLGSTNDRARELSEAGAPLPLVVIAEEQTAGRGRNGSVWHSPAGVGLWISVALPVPAGPVTTLPLRAGLAAARACEDVVPGLRVGIKWPNDLEVSGLKVGGVLCERVARAVVVGVGLNLSPHGEGLPRELVERATSLEAEARRPVSRARVAGELVRRLAHAGGPVHAGLEPEALAELAERDVLQGRRVRTQQAGEGTARGIADDGALRLETAPGRTVLVVAGSVRTL